VNRTTLLQIGIIIVAATCIILQFPLFFVAVGQRIGYLYPIDYGEGPLLRQVQFLVQGGSIAALYGNPGAPPYLVVNYPPLYLLVTQLFATVTPVLFAGRLVSALAGIAAFIAIRFLADDDRDDPYANALRWLVACTWLVIPIVREWSGVMRVDMLGVALGLSGVLLAVRGKLSWGTILIVLGLLCKPTLIAAPLALLVLYASTPWRSSLRAITSGALVLVVSVVGITLGGGQLWLHLVQSNANGWDASLAKGFWREAVQVHWPLMLGALVIAGAHLRHGKLLLTPAHRITTMAIAYTIGGMVVGVGIGKVGAYANYFLEWYAGMVWLLTIGVGWLWQLPDRKRWLAPALLALCSVGVARFYPLWSETYPKPYGMIEQQRPARVVVGSYGVWRDFDREGQILAANAVTARDLTSLIQQHGALVFTDVPGIAAQADAVAPMQVFEHRQLLDSGLWDQRPTLRQLANGQIPLVVLDYLGNWMTPESIDLIRTRYAQSGSRGSFDIYQPIAVGAPQTIDQPLGDLTLRSSALPPPIQRAAYEPGTILPVLLTIHGQGDQTPHQIHLALRDSNGQTYARSSQALFAGALTAADLAAGDLQHLQALAIPVSIGDGSFVITAQLDDTPAVTAATLTIQKGQGRVLGDAGQFAPEAFVQFVKSNGGYARWGWPLMPAMPFADMTLQCWQNGCIQRLPDGTIQSAPLGEWLRAATALLPAASDMDSYEFTHAIAIDDRFAGGEYTLADRARQDGATTIWLRRDALLLFAKDDTVTLGDGGARVLRLPGIPYRWPDLPK
jgi:hypothetical protein